MARNGSGVYAAPANSWNPAVSTTTIDSSDFNTLLADLETALTESVARDGQTATTAVVPFASGIKADTIAENSSNTGVTIDGVLVKDNGIALGAAGTLIFEGATANAFETTLTVTDPTADRTFTLPDSSGTVMANVVEDTTPQAGGDFDMNGNGIVFPSGTYTDILDDDTFGTASATTGASSESVKAYADGLVVAQANQAAIEAETNENTYIPPDLINFNPGVAKGWVNFTVAAATTASRNVSSITDTATGDWTVNWDTNFSGTGYCVVTGIERTAGSTASDREPEFQSLAVGSTRMRCKNSAGGLDEAEVAAIHVAVFGDQ